MTRRARLLVTSTLLAAGCASEPTPGPAPAPATERRPAPAPAPAGEAPGAEPAGDAPASPPVAAGVEDEPEDDPRSAPWSVERCELGLGSPDARVRRRAARELGDRASDAPDETARLVPALVARLSDAAEALAVREAAADALGALGARAVKAVPALVTALDGPEPLRERASEALGHVGRPEAVAPLAARLSGEAPPDARLWAAITLGRLGPVAGDGPTVAALAGALDGPTDLRAQALLALTTTGAGAAVAPRVVRLLAEEDDAETRGLALGLLDSLEATSPEVVGALLEALDDPDPDNRFLAVTALGLSGEGAAAAIPRLTALAADEQLGEQALLSLARLGPGAHEGAVAAARARLIATEWDEEDLAWGLLSDLGRRGAELLAEGLASPHRGVRLQAAKQCGESSEAEAVRPALEAALAGERFPDVRAALAAALAKAGGPPLVEAAEEPATEPAEEDEATHGPYTADAAYAGKVVHRLREEGKARLFHLDPLLVRSPATEELFDWEALAPALVKARGLRGQPRDRALRRAREDHLRPTVGEEALARALGPARRHLFDLSRAQLDQLLGDSVYLGDLVQTGDHRAVWMCLVGERSSKDGKALRLIDPFRVEDALTAPSYLCYPTVIPDLWYWGDRDTVEAVPLDPAFARTAFQGDRLVIGDASFVVTPEQAKTLLDPASTLRPYVHLGARSVLFHDPAKVDRAPPVEAP